MESGETLSFSITSRENPHINLFQGILKTTRSWKNSHVSITCKRFPSSMSASTLYLLMLDYILLDVTLNVGYENTVKTLSSE